MSTTLAYLAGAMDSDGHFSIKKSTYHMRVRGDASNPVYSEQAGLKQVTEDIPVLLVETFGGHVGLRKPQTENSKPLYHWMATDKIAANVACLLLPYLRVKKRQAKVLIELRETKSNNEYRRLSYWFDKENPLWRSSEMLVASEVLKILGYSNRALLSQAVGNKSILALSVPRGGTKETPRFPKEFVLAYAEFAATSKDNRGRRRPQQLIAWRERLWGEVRELNKIGVHGTPIYHRTGPYTMA